MIYASNAKSQTVASGGLVSFPNVLLLVNRTVFPQGSSSFNLTTTGVYEIEVTMNVSGAETSTTETPETYSLALAVNGEVADETTMLTTVPTGESQCVSRTAALTVNRCPCMNGQTVVTVVNNGETAPIISNATIYIRRL